MNNEMMIVAIDLIFMSMLWPTVINLWRAKNSEGHSLWTSIPTMLMLVILIPLFWPISVPIALAHIPGAIVWGIIAIGTWKFGEIDRIRKNYNW